MGVESKEAGELEMDSSAAYPSRIALRVAESRAKRLPLRMFQQPPLLSLVVGLLMFAFMGNAPPERKSFARFDVRFRVCPYLAHCISDSGIPVPDGWPEIDIHAEGYTLRSEPFGEVDLPRRNGALDTASLDALLSSLKFTFGDLTLHIYVEAGVPLDDFIKTADHLETFDRYSVVELPEPPSRGFCIEPEGCLPFDSDIVIAKLVEVGRHVPKCTDERFLVVMRYKVLRVVQGYQAVNEDIYLLQRCPELGFGSGERFRVGDTYRLTLGSYHQGPFPRGRVIDPFPAQRDIPKFASRIEREPASPPLVRSQNNLH